MPIKRKCKTLQLRDDKFPCLTRARLIKINLYLSNCNELD